MDETMDNMIDNIDKKTCEVVRITYRNPDTGWAIVKVSTDIGTGTAKGEIPETVGPGDIVTLTGKWVVEKKYGKQFVFSEIDIKPPDINTPEGVRRLLMKLPGIGDVKASWAVETFGAETAWKLALTDPGPLKVPVRQHDQVMDVARSLVSSYEEQVYFLGMGLTPRQAQMITNEFGHGKNGGMKVVKETPYRLLEISGFGFITVDSIAIKSGVNIGAEGRIAACVLFLLADSRESGGHTWFYMSTLIGGEDWKGGIDGVRALLKKTAMDNNLPLNGLPDDNEIERVVRGLARSGKVVIEDGRVFDANLRNAEKGIMECLGL